MILPGTAFAPHGCVLLRGSVKRLVPGSQGRRTYRSRAVRDFALNLPVWYRVGEESGWRIGLTERISASEVVIRSPQRMTASGIVTAVVSLPSTAAHRGGCVVARGRIKRAPRRSRFTARGRFAIAVRELRLEAAEGVFDQRAR